MMFAYFCGATITYKHRKRVMLIGMRDNISVSHNPFIYP